MREDASLEGVGGVRLEPQLGQQSAHRVNLKMSSVTSSHIKSQTQGHALTIHPSTGRWT